MPTEILPEHLQAVLQAPMVAHLVGARGERTGDEEDDGSSPEE
ncbi:MAG: hypothetical protein WC518_04395 [Patescibacteria group bacterium]